MMKHLQSIHAVTIGKPFAGAEIAETLKEAEGMELDYIVFNGVLLPADSGVDLTAYLQRFPKFAAPARLKGRLI